MIVIKGERSVRQLLEHSKRSYISAIDTYNRIGSVCRVEGFCFYMTNAWELLLKARMIQLTGNVKFIYTKKMRGDRLETKPIDDCIKYVFQDKLNPVRKNIEWISELRNQAVHYMISELECVYISYFQACAINYSSCIKDWFDVDINKEYDFPILSLFTLATDKIIDVVKLKGKYDKQIIDFVIQMQDQDRAIRESNIDNTRAQMYVPVEYKAAIVRNPKDADILLGSGDGVNGLLTVAVPKDVEKTHPHLFSDVKRILSEKFGNEVFPSGTFQTYDAKCIVMVNHFLDDNRYAHKQNKPVVWRYTDLFIDYVVDKIQKDGRYLWIMREKYRKSQNRR